MQLNYYNKTINKKNVLGKGIWRYDVHNSYLDGMSVNEQDTYTWERKQEKHTGYTSKFTARSTYAVQ